jgi:imidazolonepropionase-like amidohydrolase
VGPNVYSSLTVISCTGGHGDLHDLPLCAVTHNVQHIGSICDGADGCRLTVRNMVRQGARCIKVCTSGGVLSLNDDPEDRQFSDAELAAIVDEASMTGLTVAAHAIGKSGILAALRAGIRSIEHGCYIDDEVAEEMKKVGAVLVATRQIQEGIYADDSEFAPIIRKKIEKIVPLTRENYRMAVSRGVKIALGTDTYSSDVAHRVSHGRNGMELVYAANAGLTPLQVIEACTATPPEVLGKKAPKTGQLKPGYDADVLGVVGSPLEEISILADPDNITHVWKGGKCYKS